MQLVNPKIRVDVRHLGTVHSFSDGDIEFDIRKDLTEEPNGASVVLYGLNADSRSMIYDAGLNESPVDIYLTTIQSPSDPFVHSYRGELESAESKHLNPGYETTLICTSQKQNHRQFWFQKNYSSGTPHFQIVDDMVAAIGLPAGNVFDVTNNGILLSKSFAGPAYELLQNFVFDMGYYCYILDGKIYITSVYQPPATDLKDIGEIDSWLAENAEGVLNRIPAPTIRSLGSRALTSLPEASVSQERSMVEMHTVTEVTNKSPFPPKRRRRKKKKIEVPGANDYVSYEAVDQETRLMNFTMFCAPDINPDDVLGYGGLPYRVRRIHHWGDNKGGALDDSGGSWETEVQAELYNDDGGDYI